MDILKFREIAWKIEKDLNDKWEQKYGALMEELWWQLFESISLYVNETKTTSLELNKFKLKNEDLRPILLLVKASSVTNLDLSAHIFEDGIEDVAEIFAQTKLTKLNLSDCDLVNEDALNLMEVLKDTRISDLDLSNNDEIDFTYPSQALKFVFYLRNSHLTALNLERFHLWNPGFKYLMQALPHTAITKLNLSGCALDQETLSYFSKLPSMAITELNLSDNEMSHDSFAPIARVLRDSKLEILDLSTNELNDASMTLLMENLSGSKLISLNLRCNNISGSHDLGHYLQNSKIESLSLGVDQIKEGTMFSSLLLNSTSITTLNVDGCRIGDKLGALLIRSMKNSVVTKLNLSSNNLEYDSIIAFAEVVKDTPLEDIDFSYNKLSPAAILALGDSLKSSKIKCIDLSGILQKPEDRTTLSAFIEKIKNTPVEVVKMRRNGIDSKSISASLPGSTFTHFDLEYNKIGNNVAHLAEQLKNSGITHLKLSNNEINDEGAVALAKGLQGSRVMELDLNGNLIGTPGASALALSLKKSSLISLNMIGNKIGMNGYEALTEHAKNTLLTNFVRGRNSVDEACCGERMVNVVTFRNKILAHKIVEFFNNVKPETSTQNFRFNNNLNEEDMRKFLDECCQFYKTVLDLPAVISILSQESQFSWSQLSILLNENFSKQLTLFIEKEVKQNVISDVKFLRKVKECLQKKSEEKTKTLRRSKRQK